MKVTYDIVKPNVICDNSPHDNSRNHKSIFSLNMDEVIQVSKDINDIISRYIGELKVRESDLKVISDGSREKVCDNYGVPLIVHLNVLEDRLNPLSKPGVTNKNAKLFGLFYLIDSSNYKNGTDDINLWTKLKRELDNPEKYFDKFDQDGFLKLDRKKSLEEMKEKYHELNSKIPENYAGFVVINMPLDREEIFIGFFSLFQLKAKDSSQIDNAELALVERLKQTNGPTLSKDAIDLFFQWNRTYDNAREIVESYGDIILDPNWQRRFFRYDP